MRPTIYIGLGGTGIRAIAQTKKMYEDAYGVGKIPAQIAFMAIDFDFGAPNDRSLATDITSDLLKINYSPQQHIVAGKKLNNYSWIFSENCHYLPEPINQAPSPVRTTGRFFTESMLSAIDDDFRQRWEQVQNACMGVHEVDVHIVTSLAGGTGAGSFINIAELISRNYGRKAHLIGYGVVFSTQDALASCPYKNPNVYASMLDLDYLMHATVSNPIKFEINGSEQEFTRPIFDEFFVVDNVTEQGHTLTDIKQVCEVLGVSLFARGSDIGSRVRLVFSNAHWMYGEYNVNDKIGWVHSLGACKVVYKGDQLAQIYGCKVGIELIRKMCHEDTEAQQLALQWVEVAGVREDGEQYNMLIDSIVEPKTIERLRLPNVVAGSTVADVKSLIADYIGTMSGIPSDACIKKMLEEKRELLVEKVKQLLSYENGVGNSRVFLESLTLLCEKYRLEIDNVTYQLNDILRTKNSAFQVSIREYEEYCGKIFKTKSGKEELLDYVAEIARDIRKINYEIKRREIARDIFSYLIQEIVELRNRIEALEGQLKALSADYVQTIEQLQNAKRSIFEYDLSTKEHLNMTLKDDVSLASLLVSLPVSLLEIDMDNQLRPAIEKYVASLPRAVAYRERKIADVIEELSDEDYERLKREISVKSSSLLRVNDRGQRLSMSGLTPSQAMYSGCFISVYSPENGEKERPLTRLERDGAAYLNRTFKEFVSIDHQMCRQQILVLRVDSAIIPYCIEALDEGVEAEYVRMIEGANRNPHFDKDIYEQMKAQGFSLKPENTNNR